MSVCVYFQEVVDSGNSIKGGAMGFFQKNEAKVSFSSCKSRRNTKMRKTYSAYLFSMADSEHLHIL